MNIYIESRGCSRRKLDNSKFHKYFNLNGYTIVQDPADADVMLVTTCAFKSEEEDASIKCIENLTRYDKRMVVYGCLPTIAPTRFRSKFDPTKIASLAPKDINDIDKYFEGITYKFEHIEDCTVIEKDAQSTPLPAAIKKFKDDFELSMPFLRKSGRYLKNKLVNDENQFHLSTSRGCLGNCSFCAVRFAIGTLKSKPLPTVIQEFSAGLDKGYTEFTVLGDDVGGYGQDCQSNICELVGSLLAEIESKQGKVAIDKVSLHIEELNPKWIIRYGTELTNLLKSRHIKTILCPIQSGCQRILKLMNRNDDIDRLTELLDEIRQSGSKAEINSQLIIGFPTETEVEFDESLARLAKFKFNTVTLFPYDDKENTKAYELHPKVPESVKQARIKKAQVYLKKHGIRPTLSCDE